MYRKVLKKRSSFAFFVACVVCTSALGGCSGGDGSSETTPAGQTAGASPLTIELVEANESGQSGSAVLTDKGESSSGIGLGTGVVLEVGPPVRFPGDAQPAAIHDASCADVTKRRGFEELSATEIQPLNEVRDGRSETTAAQSLDELTRGGFAITVHEPSPPFRAVVCGDIPRL
jgi:hypothetical protein